MSRKPGGRRGGAHAPERAPGGAGRDSARTPFGRRARRLPSASDAQSVGRWMCGNNMSTPLPAVVPAARKATAAVSGGAQARAPGEPRPPRVDASAPPRGLLRGWGRGSEPAGRVPSRPAAWVAVPRELRLTFAPGNFCDEKVRLGLGGFGDLSFERQLSLSACDLCEC